MKLLVDKKRREVKFDIGEEEGLFEGATL